MIERPPRQLSTAVRLAIAQFVLVGLVACYLVYQSQSRARELEVQARRQDRILAAVIVEFRRDLTTHAHASAERSCNTVKLMQLLLAPDPRLRQVIDDFVASACLYVPPARPDAAGIVVQPHPPSSSPSHGPLPSPPGSPSSSSSPPATSSPSPSPICLPLVGCL